MRKTPFSPETVLQEHGFKSTVLRIFLLQFLNDAPIPLTVATIIKKTKRLADTATTYRALNAFVEKGLVRKLELIEGKASFELVVDNEHLHHIICDHCHTVEPIQLCMKNIHERALDKAKKFKYISNHSMSFIGTCKKCIRAIR
jgi:Fur family ferric uptake transcriptional regulator